MQQVELRPLPNMPPSPLVAPPPNSVHASAFGSFQPPPSAVKHVQQAQSPARPPPRADQVRSTATTSDDNPTTGTHPHLVDPACSRPKTHNQPGPYPTDRPSPSARRSTRQPKKRAEPVQLDFELTGLNRREQKMLKLALAKSVVETKLTATTSCPQAHIFYPTIEEFASPIAYIASIQSEAEKTGICKIVPPKGWKPAFAIDLDNSSVLFDTRLQNIHKLQEGIEYGDGRTHTFRSYEAHGDAFRRKWLLSRGMDPDTVTSDEIEQEYWRIVESGSPSVQVEYANDLDTTKVGSGFPRPTNPFFAVTKEPENVDFKNPEYYLNSAWNLNNLPYAHGSLLRHMQTTINGINVPWLYCGMLFATFCWHTEDNHMYSVNYQHVGAKKRWYGIPSTHSAGFERVLQQRVPERFRESPDLLFHLTTMVPPSLLMSQDVEVYTLIQEPGDIILTFPRAYHGGYSEGFNCNEACNFVLPSWIQYSRESIERYREVGRSSIFSHDRFMFHFGSTQSLEEYKAEECEMLLKELRLMFQEEQRYKKELQAMGLEHILELSAEVMLDDKSMEQDEVRECFLCKHNVFFSGVICTCNPTRISCLRHTKSMCRCPIQNRTLIQWVSAAEMRYVIRRVQVKIQTLRRQQQQQTQAASINTTIDTVKSDDDDVVLVVKSSTYIEPKARTMNASEQRGCGVIDLTEQAEQC